MKAGSRNSIAGGGININQSALNSIDPRQKARILKEIEQVKKNAQIDKKYGNDYSSNIYNYHYTVDSTGNVWEVHLPYTSSSGRYQNERRYFMTPSGAVKTGNSSVNQQRRSNVRRFPSGQETTIVDIKQAYLEGYNK